MPGVSSFFRSVGDKVGGLKGPHGPCSGALLTVASLLMEASRDTPDLMTCMESSIDFATQMDGDLFQVLVEAMQTVQASAKNAKSKLNKTYVVKIRLPEEATMSTLAIKASSEDLVWRLKQYVTDKIRIKNKAFPESQQQYHLENFNGDKINECLTLRDIKGKEHGVRELVLVKGWEPTALQKALGGINPCLVAACFKYYLRLMPEPLVPFNQYQTFVDSFKNNQNSSIELRCKCMMLELAKLPPASYTSLRAVCELISVTSDESWQKAYAFGPTFLRGKEKSTSAQSQEDALRAVGDVKVVFELVQFLVTQWPGIQLDLPETPILSLSCANPQKLASSSSPSHADTSHSHTSSHSPSSSMTASPSSNAFASSTSSSASSASSTPSFSTTSPSSSSSAQSECPKCGIDFQKPGFCTECGARLVSKSTKATSSPTKSATLSSSLSNSNNNDNSNRTAQEADRKKREEEKLRKEQEERVKREEAERKRVLDEKIRREAEERRKREEAEERARKEEEDREREILAKLMKEDDERKKKEAAQGEPPPGKIRCPGCKLFQLSEARFCGECGVKISACVTCKKPQVTGQECEACDQTKKEQQIKQKQQEADQRKAKLETEARDREMKAKKDKEDREKREKEERAKREKEEREKAKTQTHKVEPAPATKKADEKKDTMAPRKMAGLASMWDSKAAQADDESKNNVFSAHYDPNAAKKLKPGDKGYGSAPEGSESAVRAQRANDWVKVQVKQLIDVIGDIGTTGPGGLKQTNFGTLFVRYETISDTVVGILQRAKKYGVVTFEGEMLFQGQSNGVIISLTAASASFTPS